MVDIKKKYKLEWFLEVLQETVTLGGTDGCQDCQNSSFGTIEKIKCLSYCSGKASNACGIWH